MVAQLQILNRVLKTKDFSLISLNELDDKYFYAYKNEFNYIKNHYDTYKIVPDIATFTGIFSDFEVIDVEEPDTFLLEQLYRDFNKAYLATVFNKVKPLLENDNVEGAMDYVVDSVNGLHTGAVMTCTDLIKDVSRYDRYLERSVNRDQFYLSTGITELDDILGGIDRENENMVIIARPGVGKTQLLIKLAAEAFKAGLTVGFYEGEMTEDKIGYRLDTFLSDKNSGFTNSGINRGDLTMQKSYKNYIDSLSLMGSGSLKILTPNNVPGGEVTVDTLKTFIEKEHLDILFVDQYSLLEDNKPARTDFEHVGNIAKDIKKLQVEKHIPIISVSQMNRHVINSDNKDSNKIEQDTTQVAGSDKIPQYATTVLALSQKAEMDANSMRKSVQLTINIIKARDGGEGNQLVYDVDFNTGYFHHVTIAETEEEATELANSYKPQM